MNDVKDVTAKSIAEDWYSSFENDEKGKTEHNDVLKSLQGATILVYEFNCYSYEEDSFCLFRKNGKLFETYGTHCSCYGFEGQWNPVETSWEELLSRKYYGDETVQKAVANAYLLDSGVDTTWTQ